ncbi:uncharacterized protein LOC118645848 [Monomorium pharaonis]|uniref:uncharacterized protein LOC118645848 n=1 Tax=Monomorium pharaonis TaxID=307658 RepID=UPI00063FB29C|nr:uncharacterized protein LOC118645848 [Monomorium pharaonis]
MHKIAFSSLKKWFAKVCEAGSDTTQHTLKHCLAWQEQRCVLVERINPDLSLSPIVKAMVDSEEKWKAMASSCEEVMLQKEAWWPDRIQAIKARSDQGKIQKRSSQSRSRHYPTSQGEIWTRSN